MEQLEENPSVIVGEHGSGKKEGSPRRGEGERVE